MEFYKAQQQINESPTEWLTRIKELSNACSFGKSADLIVLDKFITGLESDIVDYLCSSADSLNINSSLEIIQAYEAQKSDPFLELPLKEEIADIKTTAVIECTFYFPKCSKYS